MKRFQKLSTVVLFLGAACSPSLSQMPPPETQPVELHSQAKSPFRFMAYGDTRLTDPADQTGFWENRTGAARLNPALPPGRLPGRPRFHLPD
jgi:hypothetical protein